MSEENLKIWNAACEVPEQFLKKMDYDSRGLTSVDAYWQIREATALFGPIGQGWGYTKPEWSRWPASEAEYVQCDLGVWHAAGDGISDQRRYIWVSACETRIDKDVTKKLITACITKALSYLGIGGDIYMGMTDGSDPAPLSTRPNGKSAPFKEQLTGREETLVSPLLAGENDDEAERAFAEAAAKAEALRASQAPSPMQERLEARAQKAAIEPPSEGAQKVGLSYDKWKDKIASKKKDATWSSLVEEAEVSFFEWCIKNNVNDQDYRDKCRFCLWEIQRLDREASRISELPAPDMQDEVPF